ncbi:MAG: host-nuclease inhibitor Gam family protein [Candidatus Kaiserbacteria bacterium]|nr:host-nuclease inhibitor Gam family protein [Candidatus Kaiserbacteria bacterium]
MEARVEALEAPQTSEMVLAAQRRIGELDTEIIEIQNAADVEKNRIQADADRRIKRRERLIARFAHGIRRYALDHRSLFSKRRSGRAYLGTLSFGTGRVGWRRIRPSVKAEVDDETLIARARASGHEEFIVVKAVLDRNAILAHPRIAERVLGVTVTGETQFLVKPSKESSTFVRSPRSRVWSRIAKRRETQLEE